MALRGPATARRAEIRRIVLYNLLFFRLSNIILITSNINFPEGATVPVFAVRPIPAPLQCRVVPQEPADTRKTRSVEPLLRLLPAIATPGHDGSPGAHLPVLEGHSLRSILNPEDSRLPGATFEDTLGEIWSSVVALILYPVVFFAVAYTRFMRTDIR